MAIYCVTGKLGSGKTLACVGRIRDALLAGKRVATNLDLNLSELLPKNFSGHVDVIRLPDKPTVDDFNFIGLGCDSPDEDRFGLIVLDELGTWFNARSWADKSRQAVIDWLLHSRKKSWDLYLLIQNLKMLDSQAREALVEFLVVCRRLDRIRVPLVGGLFKSIFGKNLTLPKVHVASVRYGVERDALVSDRWVYQSKDLYKAYDTRQVFTDRRVEPYRLSFTPALHTLSFWAYISLLFEKHSRSLSPARNEKALKPKHILVQRVMKLPPDRRIEFLKRFQACGAL